MNRTVLSLAALAAFCCIGVARAADPLKEALSVVPADAMGFIAVPSIAQLDSDYQQAITNLGLQQYVPPPMNSLVGAVKQFAPMLAGIDESGPLVIVIMPAQNVMELQMKQAVIIPAKDPKAMIEALQGKPGEGDIYSIQFFGTPSQATVVKNRVVLAMSADVAKAIKASATSIDTRLTANDLTTLAGLDLIIWLDTQRLIGMLKPLIDSVLMPMMMMQASQGGFQATSAEMNKKNMEMFFDGAATMSLGLGLESAGIDFRLGMTAKAGSELAKRTQTKTTSEPLLSGLPVSDYLMAFGAVIAPEAAKASQESIESLMALGEKYEKIDKEGLAKLRKVLGDMTAMISGIRGSVDGLPAGPDGLFGLSVIIETADSQRWIGLAGDLLELGKQLLAAAAKGDPGADPDEVKAVLGAITYTRNAEKIGGLDVSQFKFDLDVIAKLDDADVDEDELEQAKKVVGKEGLLLRVAALDGKQVLASFGGGEPRTAKLITAAKSAGAPLNDEAGIRKVSPNLPKQRGSVTYLAVDRIVQSIQAVQKVLEEEVLPVQLPPVNAPLAMSQTGGDGWTQFDLFVPSDLLVAGKNVAMTMMGGGANPKGGEQPPSGAGKGANPGKGRE